MRKSSWIILALLLVAIGAPNARAGSIKYTFTGAGKWTGTHFTYVSTTGYLSYGATVTPTDGLAVLFGMDPTTLTSIQFHDSMNIFGNPGGYDFLAAESGTYNIDALGTYKFYNTYDGDTYQGKLVISSVAATPEPSSLLLFGTSLLGLVPFRRKLFGR
jgi:PEP-CTERM motif